MLAFRQRRSFCNYFVGRGLSPPIGRYTLRRQYERIVVAHVVELIDEPIETITRDLVGQRPVMSLEPHVIAIVRQLRVVMKGGIVDLYVIVLDRKVSGQSDQDLLGYVDGIVE